MSPNGVAESDEVDLEPCDYCETQLHMATDSWIFLDISWGTALRSGQESFTFCTQQHAASHLAEVALPEPEPFDQLSTGARRRSGLEIWGYLAFIVLAGLNLAFYVLGLATWLRWVWQ